jgi:DNA-binding transcriptional MerR regulator
MRLAELSARSRTPPPTIKYYLRLGLLHPGEAQSSTWSSYDESHVRRLALVRALTEVGGLSLADVRRVLDAVDDESLSRHATMGTAQWLLSPRIDEQPTAHSRARVDALLARHGWELDPASPHPRTLAAALDRLDELDHQVREELLDDYLRAMGEVAALEVPSLPVDDPERAAETVVLGTVLHEPVLLTLRRMAHEVLSARRG